MKHLLLLAVIGSAFAGCAHHQPRSSAVIIPEGEPNPHIQQRVEHAGETVRVVR